MSIFWSLLNIIIIATRYRSGFFAFILKKTTLYQSGMSQFNMYKSLIVFFAGDKGDLGFSI